MWAGVRPCPQTRVASSHVTQAGNKVSVCPPLQGLQGAKESGKGPPVPGHPAVTPPVPRSSCRHTSALPTPGAGVAVPSVLFLRRRMGAPPGTPWCHHSDTLHHQRNHKDQVRKNCGLCYTRVEPRRPGSTAQMPREQRGKPETRLLARPQLQAWVTRLPQKTRELGHQCAWERPGSQCSPRQAACSRNWERNMQNLPAPPTDIWFP